MRDEMPEDLTTLINNLSPGALTIFKRQLASLPDEKRSVATRNLSAFPELVDIVGRGSAYSNAALKPQQPTPQLAQTDVPLWQKALSTISAPFNWIGENITQPFGAIVTSPWTPPVAGTEGMNWLEREKAQYKAWDDPNWGFLGVKGVVETLPWLLVPSAAGVAGKLGVMAAKGGALARGAALAGKVVKPIATAERIATYPIAKPLELAGKGISKIVQQTNKFTMPASGEMEKQFTKIDWQRKLAQRFGDTPVVKSIIEAVGGKAATVTEAAQHATTRALLVGGVVQEGLISKGQVALAGLRVIDLNPIRLFGVDEATGIAGRVTPKVEGISRHIADITEHPAQYILNTQQAKYIKELHNIEDWVLKGLKEEGIDIKELKFDEFSHWVHRQVIGKNIDDALMKITPRTGRRIGTKASWEKTRFYETAAEGVKKGIIYEPNPEKVINLYIQTAAKRISDQRIANMVSGLGEKPLERAMKFAPQVLKEAGRTAFIKTTTKQLDNLLNRVVRGERVIISEKLRKVFPEYTKRIEELIPSLQKGEAVGDEVQLLTKEIRQLIESAKAPYWKAKTERAIVMERARTPSLGTESTIQHPAFQGKIYPKEVADQIQEYFNDMGFTPLNKLATLSGGMRTLVASADFSAMFIQGLPSIALHPLAWSKAATMSFQSWFNPRVYEKYLVKETENLLERSHYGGYVGGFEFMEAMPILQRTAGLATKLVTGKPQLGEKVIRQTYGRFEASFGSFGDVARNEMWKALKGRAKNPEELTEIARHIDRMTGVMSTKGLGIGKTQRDFEQAFVFFAPRYTRAGFALIGDVFKGGITGAESRKALGSMMAAGAAMYAGTSKALGQTPNFDPSNGRFMTVEITDPLTGTTRHLGVGGMMTSLIRFGADVGASIIGQGMNEPLDLVKLDRFDNPFIRFLYSKSAPLTGFMEGLVSGQNYFGEPFENPGDYAVFMGEQILPIAAQSAFMEEGGFAPTSIIAEEVGLRSFPRSDWEKRDIIRDKLAQEKYKMSWDDIRKNPQLGELGQRQLELTSPELQKATEQAAQTSSKMARGEGKIFVERKKEAQTIEDAYRKEITLASKEFEATRDGRNFRERVDFATNARRVAYARMETDPKYKVVYDYFNEPLKPEDLSQMTLNDQARRIYYQIMYSDDMFDDYGNYKFDEADRREAQFVQKYGQGALDYIEEFRGTKWEAPVALKALRESRQMLEPYWKITDYVWSLYPPELKDISDQIIQLENTEPVRARQILKKYPQILRARELIARYKKAMRNSNPLIAQAYATYYG